MSYRTEQDLDSPLSRWRFEETSGSVVDDDLTTANDGTIVGGVALGQPSSPQVPGAALGADFNGTTGYVSFANASGLLGIGTIEAVVQFDTIPASSANPIFTHAWTAGQIIPLALGFNMNGGSAGRLQVGYYTGSVWVVATWATTPTAGIPYHIVGKYDGTTLKLRVNGTEVASTTVGTVRPTSGSVNATAYIGRRWDSAQYHDGKIWDLAIYAAALSDARADEHYRVLTDDGLAPTIATTNVFTENGTLHVLYTLSQGYMVPVTISVAGDVVQTFNVGGGKKGQITLAVTPGQPYSLTLTPSNSYGTGSTYPLNTTPTANAYYDQVFQDNPAIYHPMQENSGTAARDYGSGSRDGVYAGGATVADTSDPIPLRAFGNHVRLDGTDDHILLDSSNWFTPASGFTFEGMFYFRSWSNWMRIFDFANSPSSDDMYFAANSSGTMQIRVNGAQFTFPRFDLNKWIHLVVTVTSAGAATVYVDGNVYASGTVGTPVNAPRAFKYIGRSAYPDPYLAASVAHVSIYNSVLSQARVQAHAAEIATRPQDLMVLAYLYTYVNVGHGYVAPNQNAYFLAEVNIGQNSPPARTAFIEADAFVVARRFIGWGVPITKL